MPCLNNKQHRHSIFHRVKQLLITLLSCIYIQDKFVCLLLFFFFFFLTTFMWKQEERMDIFMVKMKKDLI